MSKYSPVSWKKEACYLLLFHSLLKQDGNFPSTWKSILTEIKISYLWQVTRSTAFWTEPEKSCNFRQHVGNHPCLWIGNWPVWPEVEPPFWFTEGSLRTSFFGSSIPGGFKLIGEAVSENITLFFLIQLIKQPTVSWGPEYVGLLLWLSSSPSHSSCFQVHS